MQKLTDKCALFLPELSEGRELNVLLVLDEGAGGAVDLSFPRTTLPRLRADSRSQDRFRTGEKKVPISAKGGACAAQRTQYYEGRRGTVASEYLLLFHNDEGMGSGDCSSVPLPCSTEATLAISWTPGT